MAGTKHTVKAGSRILQVSNLEKSLYPGVSKAEVIHYYLSVAPWMMRYIKYRPLSLIRYPDGIEGEVFYQKDLPRWRPDWLTIHRAGKERTKNYVTVTEEAALVWLANLACLELHQMHYRSESPGRPDYLVFDLDPPERFPFDELKSLTILLKEYLEQFGYRAYLKTSGNKGLHIFLPVIPAHTSDQCFEAAKKLAEGFVKAHPQTTLALRKESRKGRVLIDIYRNRESQTIVCPLSLRGIENAPVSMPIFWESLEELDHSGQFTLQDVPAMLEETGDPWEGMEAFAVALHTQNPEKITADNPPGDKHKTPEQLLQYAGKRDFSRTREPRPNAGSAGSNAFVVHRHDASHLHYDLRLEEDGVLRSWAVPKGLPSRPGEKRLAVETEDHPFEYLSFEGEIPKGEYGGGQMLIAATGRYTVTKKKKEGFYFRLDSPEISGEYRIHRTRDKEWLLERVDKPVPDWTGGFIKPMLAGTSDQIPGGKKYRYELKWDGIRAILALDEGSIRLYSRNGVDMTVQFPELCDPALFRGKCGVFDGEIVCLDPDGRPDFKKVMKRFQSTGTAAIAQLSRSAPAYLYLFDVLYADGIPLVRQSQARRRIILESSLKNKTGYVRISEMLADGKELFEATRAIGLEGIMCKDLSAVYSPGKRTDAWIKVKVRKEASVEIVGYTKGKGSLDETLGAVHIVEHTNGQSIYRGKVGTGFTERKRQQLFEMLEQNRGSGQRPGFIPADRESQWLANPVPVIVQYASVNKGGVFREPVFVRIVK